MVGRGRLALRLTTPLAACDDCETTATDTSAGCTITTGRYDMPPSPSARPPPLSPSSRSLSLVAPPSPAWSPPDIPFDPADLPRLPPVADPDLGLQARTAKNHLVALRQGSSTSSSYDHEIQSYRRLEWLGDSYLHVLFSERIFRRFPNLSSGGLSVRRSHLPSSRDLREQTMLSR